MEKVFRDPVHDYITVNHPVISELIDTAEFQRLRRIKQLGTSSFTFHGAEHTRFSHCLGVYHIAKRITDYFSRNFPLEWNPDENLLTQCAEATFSGKSGETLRKISLISVSGEVIIS